MINLRYHIVSITAVFLALGIGVTLGSSLIQRYTIDTLEGRLDELGERLDRTDGENRELRDEIQRRDEFDEQLGQDARVLFGGHLENVPVVVLAAQGTDDALLDDTRQSLRTAGAELSGVLVFTSRWDELSEGEVEELSTLLGRTFSNDWAMSSVPTPSRVNSSSSSAPSCRRSSKCTRRTPRRQTSMPPASRRAMDSGRRSACACR